MHAGRRANDRRAGPYGDFTHNNYVAEIDP